MRDLSIRRFWYPPGWSWNQSPWKHRDNYIKQTNQVGNRNYFRGLKMVAYRPNKLSRVWVCVCACVCYINCQHFKQVFHKNLNFQLLLKNQGIQQHSALISMQQKINSGGLAAVSLDGAHVFKFTISSFYVPSSEGI